MKTKRTELNVAELIETTGGVHVLNKEFGGGVYQVVYLTNPFEWTVGFAEYFRRNKK